MRVFIYQVDKLIYSKLHIITTVNNYGTGAITFTQALIHLLNAFAGPLENVPRGPEFAQSHSLDHVGVQAANCVTGPKRVIVGRSLPHDCLRREVGPLQRRYVLRQLRFGKSEQRVAVDSTLWAVAA